MKLSCDVIKDILPLYIEDLASDESRRIVDEHISTCSHCRNELEDMKSPAIAPLDTDTRPLEKIRDSMRKKKYQTVLLTIALTLIIAIVAMTFLTAPDYLNHTATVSIAKNSDGTVLAFFDESVSGYDIEKYYGTGGYIYNITTWNSIWSRNFKKTELDSIVLNPGEEIVESVYYYHTNGIENKLIYGKNQHPNGGSMILPRLALSYYLLMAMGIIGICFMVILLFRNNRKIRDIMVKFALLPVSYIIGHILVKGFTSSSYSMLRDFTAIVLLMFVIYAAILLAMNIMKNKSIKRSKTINKV